MGICTKCYKHRAVKQAEGSKRRFKMTDLKASSGPTSEPVQGRHSGLILGFARWSFNRLFVDPEVPLKRAPFCRKKHLGFFCGPQTGFLARCQVGPHPAVQRIYIYIYIYIVAIYAIYIYIYWPFEVLLSGPSLLFTKHCLSKNTIQIGVSALFFSKQIARANLRCYYLGQVGHF